ncbi:hypothetical protein LUZ60_014177 [Juncus effusus]|nr:hypothetical protein LUZ60_014177 [Juncus effusus]
MFPPPADSPVSSPFPPSSDSPVSSPFPPPSDSPSSPPPPDGNIQTDIIQNSFNYLMSINLGTPAKELIAIADTGSDLIWATCEPCTNCYKQNAPRFNPSASHSYSDLPCSAKQCTQLPTSQCDSSKCSYLYSYGDGSQTLGNLATETLTFNTTTQSTVNFTKVSFGCSHQANGTFDPRSAGLVGLGGGPLSLISQLGWAINHRFSYCLVPFNNANVTTSKLSFGSDATVSGDDVEVTDMVSDTDGSTFYTVTLDGITVGGNNSLSDFQSTYIIVDSGTTLTYLDPRVVDSLVETLSSTIKLPQVKDDQGMFPLCFDDSSAGLSSYVYPDITLQLGKATITLKPYNSFIKIQNNVMCLAITPFKGQSSQDKSLSILGNIAQQNFHVGYDLGTRKVSFAPADCTKY